MREDRLLRIARREKERAQGRRFEPSQDIPFGYVTGLAARDGYVWVQAGEAGNVNPLEVYAGELAGQLRSGMRVFLKEDPKEPSRWRVVRVDAAFYADNPAVHDTLPVQGVESHRETHEMPPGRPGGDPLRVWPHAITEFAVRPTAPPSMRVAVYPGWYPGGSNYQRLAGPILSQDFTSDIPGTGGQALIVAIGLTSAGALAYYNGTAYIDGTRIPSAAWPAVPITVKLLSAVRLVNGMSTIDNAHFDVEMRALMGQSGGGGSAWLVGTTAERTAYATGDLATGQPWYDTTLNLLVFWTGAAWIGGHTLTENDSTTAALAVDASGDINIPGTLDIDTDLNVDGTLTVAEDLLHTGDPDTGLTYTDNQVDVSAGGNVATLDSSGDLTTPRHVILPSGADVYPGGDGAGLFQRAPNFYRTPTDHFNAFSGYTWDSTDFGGAPNVIDTSTAPSVVAFNKSSGTGTSHFAYVATNGSGTEEIYARLSKGTPSYVGLRFDDGTNNNYVEWRLVDGTTAGTVRFQTATRVAAGSPTVTSYADFPSAWYHMRLRCDNGTNTFYYGSRDTSEAPLITSFAISWTSARVGILYTHAGTIANARKGFFDWVQIITT